MDKPRFAHWVVQQLQQGTQTIDPRAEWRLRQSREQAVQLARSRMPAKLAMDGNSDFNDFFDDSPLWLQRTLALLLFFALLLVVLGNATQPAPGRPIPDADTQMLTGDLPLSAYTDKGFVQWISTSGKH